MLGILALGALEALEAFGIVRLIKINGTNVSALRWCHIENKQ